MTAPMEALSRLPAGTIITRREYSWAVELPSRKGYKSCGTTLEGAIEHALDGAAALELHAHDVIAAVFS